MTINDLGAVSGAVTISTEQDNYFLIDAGATIINVDCVPFDVGMESNVFRLMVHKNAGSPRRTTLVFGEQFKFSTDKVVVNGKTNIVVHNYSEDNGGNPTMDIFTIYRMGTNLFVLDHRKNLRSGW